MSGIVYVLSNPSMPGIVKIGKTIRCPYERANELFTSGVPEEFEVEYAVWCEDHHDIELAMHLEFAGKRVSGRREFFKVDVYEASLALANKSLPGCLVAIEYRDAFSAWKLKSDFAKRTGVPVEDALEILLAFLPSEAMDLCAAKWQQQVDLNSTQPAEKAVQTEVSGK